MYRSAMPQCAQSTCKAIRARDRSGCLGSSRPILRDGSVAEVLQRHETVHNGLSNKRGRRSTQTSTPPRGLFGGERLHWITLNLNVELHAAQNEALRAEIPHTVFVRDSCAFIDRYTCGVYAFDLIEDPSYIDIASFGMGTTYAGKEFIDYLLRTGLLAEKADSLITAGDLIMYFQD